ncbi:MAG: hypothetical protein PF518_18225, partial [Spirochaetaceae bacterium]|nr:hypothetical protein [Spirochaetaceae bacterium]
IYNYIYMNKFQKSKLIILGGFLGSGKTTLMMKLSKILIGQGKTVSVITNDQGGFLVDTAFAQSNGITSAEVTNGCFCCNFPDLISNIKTLADDYSPDYIIAEAVGSCTDLNATVLLPLKKHHADLVDLTAYFVLVDGARVIDEYSRMELIYPASPKEILVSHQIKEASRILLSKSDFIEDDEIQDSINFIKAINNKAEIIPISARNDKGLDTLIDLISNNRLEEISKTIPLDYNIYAEAEAEYGWYNGKWKFISEKKISSESLGNEILEFLRFSIPAEIAHGKVLLNSEYGSAKVSLAANRINCDFSDVFNNSQQLIITLNIRAAIDPETITKAVDALLEKIKTKYKAVIGDYDFSSIIPAPPKPSYRLSIPAIQK